MRALNDCIKEDKSKADKMLEELGYKLYNVTTAVIQYYKEDELFGEVLTFWLKFKTFNKYNVTIQELQAINEKCKELGWLDKEI